MGCLRALLCVFLPPLAVVDKGCGSLLIVVVLTLLGWVPGIIAALIISSGGDRPLRAGGYRHGDRGGSRHHRPASSKGGVVALAILAVLGVVGGGIWLAYSGSDVACGLRQKAISLVAGPSKRESVEETSEADDGGGESTEQRTRFRVYDDPSSGGVSPGPLVGYLSPPVTLGGKAYYLGGCQAEPYSARVYAYDIGSNSWQDLGEVLPYGMFGVNAAIASNGKIYVGPQHGPTGAGGWGSHRRVVEYDPVRNTAAEKAPLRNSNVWDVASASSGDYVYFFGGWDGSVARSVWRYAPATDSVTHLGNLLTGVGKAPQAIRAADGKIYLFFGFNDDKLLVFDPRNETVSDPHVRLPDTKHHWRVFNGPAGKIHLAGLLGDGRCFTLDTRTLRISPNERIQGLPTGGLYTGIRDERSNKIYVYGGGASAEERTQLRAYDDP